MEKKKITEILDVINKQYSEKNAANLDGFYEEVFHRNAVVMGTSLGELCKTKEEIIALFKADFAGWGDFKINTQNIEIKKLGNHYFVETKATLKVDFKISDKTYDIFLDEVDFLDSKFEDKKLSALEMIYVISHVIKDREGKNRSYLWEFDFDLILSNKENHFKCDLMQFSYPFPKNECDVILNLEKYYDDLFHKELNFFQEMSKMDSELSIEIANKMKSEDDSIENITSYCKTIDNKKSFAFYGIGSYDKDYDFNTKYQRLIDDFKQMDNDKIDRLFFLVRDLTNALYQSSLKKRIVPYRVMGIVDTENNEMKIAKMKTTYPYMVILENKGQNDIPLKESIDKK